MRRASGWHAVVIALATLVLVVGLTAPHGAAVWRMASHWISAETDSARSRAGWTVTGLGVGGASFEGAAEGINDDGVIVGWQGDWDTRARAFLWKHGTLVDLGSPQGLPNSAAQDINERGQVVGTAWGDDYAASGRAFLWEHGRFTDLGTLGGHTSFAEAINERGQIVGTTFTKGGDMRGFLWENGRMRDLGTLGGPDSEAHDINDRTQIVGSSLASARTDDTWDSTRPFVWEHGEMRNLDSASGEDYVGFAAEINNAGAILVKYKASEGDASVITGPQDSVWLGTLDAYDLGDGGLIVGVRHERPAFRRIHRPKARTLPSLVGSPQPGAAYACNSAGQIVGWSEADGSMHAVLWTLKR
jgi:probable HAF family extracellular repeat protein